MHLENPKAGPSELNDMVLITGTAHGATVSFHVHWKQALSLSGQLDYHASQISERLGDKGPGESAVAAVG